MLVKKNSVEVLTERIRSGKRIPKQDTINHSELQFGLQHTSVADLMSQ